MGTDIMSDDAYYYTVVARNFVSTGKMTFDGISTTNGYHPLWFWVQVLVYLLGGLRLSVISQVVTIVAIQWAVVGGMIGTLVWWAHREWSARPSAVVAVMLGLALLLNPKHVCVLVCGMESTLVFPSLIVFLYFVWRSRWKTAGLAACFLVMARLDTFVYIVLPVALLETLRSRTSAYTSIKHGFGVAGPPALLVSGLMTVYQVAFGHPMPIHGVCRSSFPIPHVQLHLLISPVLNALESRDLESLCMINLPTALLILPICGFVFLRPGFLSKPTREAGLWLVVLGLLQLISVFLFQTWAKPIPKWYLPPLVIFTAGAIGAAIVDLVGSRWALRLCLLIAVAVLVLTCIREHRRRPVMRSPSEFERFVEARSEDAVWAATDCGHIAFWTGARFVNLDGLINGFDYQKALRDRKLGNYLERVGVRYLVVGIWERQSQPGNPEPMYMHRVAPSAFAGDYEVLEFYVYSYMYDAYSDSIVLRSDQEVWRSKPMLDGLVPARTAVFDLGQ